MEISGLFIILSKSFNIMALTAFLGLTLKKEVKICYTRENVFFLGSPLFNLYVRKIKFMGRIGGYYA